jgi:glycosyltransferase involved in cell wall biosynthesis
MKILYLVSTEGITLNQQGGAGTHIRGTISGFESNNHQVMPVILEDYIRDNSAANKQQSIDYSDNTIRNRTKRLLPEALRLTLRDFRTYIKDRKWQQAVLKLARDFEPDFIYERGCLFTTSGLKLAKTLNIPHFYETHGNVSEIHQRSFGLSSILISNKLECWKMKRTDCIVTTSDASCSHIREKFAPGKTPIITKHLGIDTTNTNASPELKPLYKKYNIPEDNFIIGFVGTFASYHKVDLLLNALSGIPQEQLTVILVGGGGEEEKIKEMCKTLNLQNVIFTGLVPKKEADIIMQTLNIGIVPDADPLIYPIKILEYGINYCCPVVPQYDAFDGVIKNNLTGITFNPGNVESLRNSILDAINNKETTRQIAEKWHNEVKSKFEWKHTVHNVLEIADKLIRS